MMSTADRIELRHVRAFLVLAQELNFRSAAERLFITEPPLSRTIAQMESALGTRLFNRTSRSCELTEAGARLIEPAARIVQILKEEFRPLQEATASGPLRLGVLIYNNPLKTEKLRADLQRTIGRKVEVRLGRTHELERSMKRGELDFAILQRPLHSTAGGVTRLATAEWVIGLQSIHPLAAKKALQLSDLFAFDRLLFQNRRDNPPLFDHVHGEIMRRTGRSPTYTAIKELFEGQALIAAGAACALVPETAKGFSQDEITILPLVPEDQIRTDICLMSHPQVSDACLMETIRRTARDFLVQDCGLAA
ncbi:LysR family transcriptional regulator [Ramlibacter humi]|uniref:LysR family transcriptional regulator n=1 Tax=Ramlibacter humi TaxID=2530451 RepID=A0A4Z0C8S8_9BURK|nr:LysR family transcriptional regulator [Ramlibacter humi]TFZ07701.1 LysR family transcriptional regulator [Ramlibacter humi]